MLWTPKKSLVAMATVAMEKLAIPKMKASGLVFLIMSRILMNFLIIGQSVDNNLRYSCYFPLICYV